MQRKKLQGWGYSWALQEQLSYSEFPSWRLQHNSAAAGMCLSAWARDNCPVLKCHPTAGEVLCCRGSRGQELISWWGVCDGWSCQAQLNPPRTSRSPFHAEPGAASHCCPCRAGRDLCLKAQEDSWEHEWAEGNERTATTRWLMAPIWTLLTAQSLGTSAETD